MSDPERLLDGPLPDGLADLLKSSEGERHPRSEARRQAILAAIAADTAVPPRSGRFRKLAGLGLGAVIVMAAAIGAHSMSSSRPAPAPAAPIVATAAPTPEPTPTPTVALPSMSVNDLPTARVDTPAPAPKPALPTEDDELEEIDAARGALAAGNANGTLTHVQRYRTQFTSPHFGDEADALEVQALAALGRTEEARAKAKAFFTNHPRSPYAQRVRTAAGTD